MLELLWYVGLFVLVLLLVCIGLLQKLGVLYRLSHKVLQRSQL